MLDRCLFLPVGREIEVIAQILQTKKVTTSGIMGNGIANNTLTNVWRWQRTGRMMKSNQKILAGIRQKKDHSLWQRPHFSLGKHIQGWCVCKVQVEDQNDGILEFDTQQRVQNAIFNEVH